MSTGHASQVDTVKLPSQAPSLLVRSHGKSDKGRVRGSNEDQFLIAEIAQAMRVLQATVPQPRTQFSNERSYLFAVADGMGGHNAGEEASAAALESVADFVLNKIKWLVQRHALDRSSLSIELQSALQVADRRIFNDIARRPEFSGMGTTLTLAYNLSSDLFVIHAGDSRCYLFRDHDLHVLTDDHTVVAEMVQRGIIRPEEAARHRYRHVITNVLGGTEEGVRADARKVELKAGDTILLCSDGLTDMVPDSIIRHILDTDSDPEQACERLIAEANERGGEDNITAVVVRFDPLDESDGHAGTRPV